MQKTRTVQRFNYAKAAFMVYVFAMLAFIITNAVMKILYLKGCGY